MAYSSPDCGDGLRGRDRAVQPDRGLAERRAEDAEKDRTGDEFETDLPSNATIAFSNLCKERFNHSQLSIST
jgi:hypothetical protein